MSVVLISCHTSALPAARACLHAQVDNEDLVFALEVIVEKFGESIAPFALQMAQQLSLAFWKYANMNDEEEDDDDMGEQLRMQEEEEGGRKAWMGVQLDPWFRLF